MTFLPKIGRFFFEWRDKLPIPLVLGLAKFAKPTKISWAIGLPLVVLGEMLRIFSLKHIGPTTRTRDICADDLVTTGAYSCTRNPLYLGNYIKTWGFLTIAGNFAYGLLVCVFFLIEFLGIIAYEEDFLREKFPEKYEEFEKTPAFFPKLSKLKNIFDKGKFSFMEALRSERKTFQSTGAILIFLALISNYKRGVK
jgi:hypothetical protein